MPSFQKLKKYFVDEYLPAAFDQVGVWQMPQGAEYYAYLARRHTTTDLTPQQIHEKGLSEVARIRGEMQTIMEKVGFKGTLPEFFTKLRTDPQFFYKTPEELLEAYRAMAKRIDPNLVKVFKTLPRMPYGVTPIPDKIAPDTTTAYYNQPAADGSRAGLLLRQSLQARDAAEVGDDGALAARSRAGPSPADRPRAGAGRHPEVPPLRRLHRFRRRLGSLRRIARRGDGALRRSLLRSSASSPTKCGARCGWSSTPACTT